MSKIVMNKLTLKTKISEKIRKAKSKNVFIRDDFKSLGGYDQIGRALKELTKEGRLIKIGYGLYAKAIKSSLTGNPMIASDSGFWGVSEEALKRLKVKWRVAPIDDEKFGTQVRANAAVIVESRFNRKIETDKFKLKIIIL